MSAKTRPAYEVRRFGKGWALFRDGVRVSGVHGDYHRACDVAARRSSKDRRTWRPCLCCGDRFPSEGAHNRLCDRCRKSGDADVDYRVAV